MYIVCNKDSTFLPENKDRLFASRAPPAREKNSAAFQKFIALNKEPQIVKL